MTKVPKKAPRPVRVVHIITLLELGGAQGNTIHTVTHLSQPEFEAHLWSGQGAYWDNRLDPRLKQEKRLRFFRLLVRPIHPLFDVLVIVQLWWQLKLLRPDIVHTHSSKAGIVGRIAARLARVPVVVHTVHGFGFNDRQRPWVRRLFVTLERFTAQLSDRLIFVSESNRDEAQHLGIGDRDRSVLIRSGVPLQKIRMEAAGASREKTLADLEIPSGASVITTIGAFKPQKNLRDFFTIARSLTGLYPELYFLIIGDGDLRPVLEALRREWGLEKRLKMPGWRHDVPACLAATSVFVLTSLWEGLPRALVEALALGVPSVCYDADGVRDLLSKGGGILIKRGDVSTAVSRIQDLLEHRPVAETLRTKGISLITDDYDIDAMVRRQEELYRTLVRQVVQRGKPTWTRIVE